MRFIDNLAMGVGYVVLFSGAGYLLLKVFPAMLLGIAKGIKEQPHAIIVYTGGILFWVFLFKASSNKGYLIAALVSSLGGLLLYIFLDNRRKPPK